MSHWDSGRPADGQYDAPQPSWPDGTSYPYPLPFPLSQALDAEDELWLADGLRSPGERGQPGERRYPGERRPPGDSRDGDQRPAPYPTAGERVQFDVTLTQPVAAPPPESSHPWPPAPYPASLRGAAPGTGEEPGSAGREHGSRRWPVLAGIVAGAGAVGAAAVLLAGSHSSSRGTGDLAAPSAKPTMAATMRAAASPTASASPSHRASPSPSASASAADAAPLTLAQAQAVLATYTATNNSANAQRSDTLLATVEAGSSYAIDAGMYQAQAAAGAAAFAAFSPVQATYYIPRDEPATGARWFVVQVANAFTSDLNKVTSTEYLLFTQSSPGAAWQNVVEPYLVTGASVPRIAADGTGLVTAVSPDAAALAVAPGQLAATTAASLDGTGTGQAVADPGNLTDKANQHLWQGEVAGGTVTDTHAAADGADGQEFALLTTTGGALVFYTDAAKVTITPPAGSALHLTVPGLYSPSQGVSQAAVDYQDQFAAYDPPAGSGAPRVVADYSGITGKG